MVRQVAVALALAAGCYHSAREATCTVTCGDGTTCPSGLSCIGGLCRASSSDTCGSSGGVDDARPDSPVPSDACPTYGTGLFQIVLCPGNSSFSIPSAFDTDSDCTGPHTAQATVNTLPVCVVYAHMLMVNDLRATGTAPLVLAADNLQVSGLLDVSGMYSANGQNGAGSSFGCGAIGSPSDVGAGGPGGAASGAGGAGGASNDGVNTLGPPSRPLAELQGGCPGAPGYKSAGMLGGGGPGGGVIYLIGRTQLVLVDSLKIRAAGAGGEGGVAGGSGGGGGGGAGGLIGLDSNNLMVGMTVSLCANGGGGGGGGNGTVDGTAQPGSNGLDGCGTIPATGGQEGGSGGVGGDGNGSAAGARNGSPGHNEAVNTDYAGGGGGGGAAGYIYVHGNITPAQLDMKATLSPPAQ